MHNDSVISEDLRQTSKKLSLLWVLKRVVSSLNCLTTLQWMPGVFVFIVLQINEKVNLEHYWCSKKLERGFTHYFFWANQRKADSKIFSWIQCEFSKDRRDWHTLAGNNERIISHNLNRWWTKNTTFVFSQCKTFNTLANGLFLNNTLTEVLLVLIGRSAYCFVMVVCENVSQV